MTPPSTRKSSAAWRYINERVTVRFDLLDRFDRLRSFEPHGSTRRNGFAIHPAAKGIAA